MYVYEKLYTQGLVLSLVSGMGGRLGGVIEHILHK